MIEMKNWATQAVAKLEEGRKEIPAFDADELNKKIRDSKLTLKQKEQVLHQARVSIVADKACEMLSNLCQLDAQFAQVVAEGSSLGACLEKALKDVDYVIGDLELVKKCATFYFPAAKVEMEMRIDTAGEKQDENTPVGGRVLHFNLDDFLI